MAGWKRNVTEEIPMWVESRNGKYIFRERYLAVDGAARTVSISLSSNSKIAAKKAHTLLQAKIAEKQDNRPGRTLESVLDDYIVGRKLAVKPLTLRNYDLFRRRILAAFPGDRDVTTITARDWQRAFDALALHVSPNAARYTWRFAKRRWSGRNAWMGFPPCRFDGSRSTSRKRL